jgi:hypothetical protein
MSERVGEDKLTVKQYYVHQFWTKDPERGDHYEYTFIAVEHKVGDPYGYIGWSKNPMLVISPTIMTATELHVHKNKLTN